MKNLTDYIDGYGLIVNRGDGTETGGGDTLNKEGHYWFASGLDLYAKQLRPQTYSEVSNRLRHSAGVFIRYPIAPYNEPFIGEWATSRDQMRPWICGAWAGGPNGSRDIAEIYHWLKIHKWFGPNFKFWSDLNGDYFGIEIQQILELSQHVPIRRPFKHFMADCSRLFHCTFQAVRSRVEWYFGKDSFVGDTVNLIPEVIWAYLNNRFGSSACVYILNTIHYGGPQWCYDRYFRQDFAPPINECMRTPIKRFFG